MYSMVSPFCLIISPLYGLYSWQMWTICGLPLWMKQKITISACRLKCFNATNPFWLKLQYFGSISKRLKLQYFGSISKPCIFILSADGFEIKPKYLNFLRFLFFISSIEFKGAHWGKCTGIWTPPPPSLENCKKSVCQFDSVLFTQLIPRKVKITTNEHYHISGVRTRIQKVKRKRTEIEWTVKR